MQLHFCSLVIQHPSPVASKALINTRSLKKKTRASFDSSVYKSRSENSLTCACDFATLLYIYVMYLCTAALLGASLQALKL